jgi:hypothetical protein
MGFEVDEVIRMFESASSADVVDVMCSKRTFNWSRVRKIVLANPDIDPAQMANLGGSYEGMFSLPDNAPTFNVGRKPIPVNAIGTGLMMISRACFERVRVAANLVPYEASDGRGLCCYPFFRSAPGVGEDMYFAIWFAATAGHCLVSPMSRSRTPGLSISSETYLVLPDTASSGCSASSKRHHPTAQTPSTRSNSPRPTATAGGFSSETPARRTRR